MGGAMRLDGSRILITGGARGLGRRFALDLCLAGASIGICDVDAGGLCSAEDEARRRGTPLWTTLADVASEPQVEKLFAEFVAHFGGIDAAVINAGVTRDGLLIKNRDGELKKFPLADWQLVVDVNLTGAFLCGREAAYHMVAQETGGVIVSMSSITRTGNIGQTNYSATKAGVAAMTEVWARELSRYGIRTAAIAPGYARTDMVLAVPGEILQRIVERIPLGRLADEAEISHALRFVLENDYINGRVIEVDGGLR
jgi:3-oxoacyl-[acyl-carrier protein] reductase